MAKNNTAPVAENTAPNRRVDTVAVIKRATNTPEELKELMQRVDTNPAKVEWPRDTWGFTSPVKKELLKALSAIKGDADKTILMESVLIIALKHMKARAEADVRERALRSERLEKAQEERLVRQRVYGTGPDTTLTQPK
jgi:hypothetical protein